MYLADHSPPCYLKLECLGSEGTPDPCPTLARWPRLLGGLGPRLMPAPVVDASPEWTSSLLTLSLCTCCSSHLELSSPYSICFVPKSQLRQSLPQVPNPQSH